ncbi:MAG TPA: ATP-binding protein [Bryobacteraceae bacterium]|nr:ATP-binding protein [Bryobacteraceae bacterium]
MGSLRPLNVLILRTVAAALGLLVVTAICRAFPVNQTTASLSLLLLVLGVASGWGLTPAITSALVGTVCLNYFFLPPIGTFTIAAPENWVALLAFLTTAVIASELSNRARHRAAEAVAQRREVDRLYELSRAVLLDSGEGPLGGTIAHLIAETFDLRAVLLFDAQARRSFSAGPEDIELSGDELEQLTEPGALPDGSRAAPIRLGNKPAGILIVRGAIGQTALEAVANLIAISLEKVASQEIADQARTARRNEELKSSILDALAHDFKTPLTSIKAASTSLLAGRALTADHQQELASIIDEEADRLTALVTEALQVARIEAGKVKLNKSPTHLQDVVSSVLGQMKSRLEDRPIELHLDPDLPSMPMDRDLIELAFRQLFDNAIKYSHPGTPVSICANRLEGFVHLTISDSGPGIPAREQNRIFERFYRGEHVRDKLPGTGVGLSVVRDIANAHSGSIRVESQPRYGSTFTLELPVPPVPAS